MNYWCQVTLTLMAAALVPATFTAKAEPLKMHTRAQVKTADYVPPPKAHTKLDPPLSTRPFTYVHRTVEWDPEKTALIIVNMWDKFKAPFLERRMAELAPHINETASAARDRGVLIVHSPAGTMDHYKDTPQRERCLEAPSATPPVPIQENPLDPAREAALPIDDTNNGWEGPIRAGTPQERQHPAIEIGAGDAIGEGSEVYNLLKVRGIENVILMGVHTNFDLLGGPVGIRQMSYLGFNVVVARDLTDSRYTPEKAPKVSHFRGTELVIEHIEQYWCPTIASTDFMGKPAFRFAEDTRPHVAFIVSDDHYHADKTIPEFAQFLREEHGIHATVLHGEGGHSIPGMENLAAADAAVVYVRRLGLPEAQLQMLRDYVASGKPLLGLRTASHAFKLKNAPEGSYEVPEGHAEWGSFDPEVLGGSYHGHEANEAESDIRNVNTEHPIMRGVAPAEWHSKGSLYNAAPIADDAVLLQEGGIPGVTEPVTWVREAAPGRGKVFYTSLGYPDDFNEPAFRQLLVNAVKWAVEGR